MSAEAPSAKHPILSAAFLDGICAAASAAVPGMLFRRDEHDITQLRADGTALSHVRLGPAAQGIAWLEWLRAADGHEIQAVWELIMLPLTIAGCSKVLVDTRLFEASWSSLNDWLANDLTPRFITAGMRAVVVITSRNVLADASAGEYRRLVQPTGLSVRLLPDTEQALAWLNAQH